MIVTGSSSSMLGRVMCPPLGGFHGNDAGFFVALGCGMAGWLLCAHWERPPLGKYVCLFNASINETVMPSLQAENFPLPVCLKVCCRTYICLLTIITIIHIPDVNDTRNIMMIGGTGIHTKSRKIQTYQVSRKIFNTGTILSYFCLLKSAVLTAGVPHREGSGECLRQVSPSHLHCWLGIW